MVKTKNFGIFLLVSIFLMPYLFSIPYRIDQILIPVTVIYCLIFYKIEERFLYLSLLLLVFSFVLPLFSTLINLKTLSFIGVYDMIKETQNILKPFIYLLFGYFLVRYFRLGESDLHKILKLLIVITFIVSFSTFFMHVSTGSSENFLNDFMVQYYHLHSNASNMLRYPGLLMQPASAGTYFIFFSFLCIVFNYPYEYLILVVMTGILSNTKVFWFSLPFFFIIVILNSKNPKKIFQFLLGLIVVLIVFNFLFGENLTKSFEFVFGVIKADPLGGRGENFVAANINDLLNNYPIFGVGFTKTKLMYQSISYGTWDSLFFYELAFGGLIGLITKTIIFFLIFYVPFKEEKFNIRLSVTILLINILLAGLGTTSFYQERIGDIMFVFFGFYYAIKFEQKSFTKFKKTLFPNTTNLNNHSFNAPS